MSFDSASWPPPSAALGTSEEARAAFAALVDHFEPYASEIVFIGGWVHALYLAEVHAAERPVATDDIDVTIPRRLPTEDRPTLLELATAAGFEHYSHVDGASVTVYRRGEADASIDVDLMTEASSHEIVPIDGQPNLLVDGYAGQQVLLENSRWMEVGTAVHPSLKTPARIRVPTLSAYVLQKGLASETRRFPDKSAKDIVYIFEIVRHETLGREARAGMPALAARYPAEWARWLTYIDALVTNRALLRLIATQLIEARRLTGSIDVVIATVVARLRRFASEAAEVDGQTIKAIAPPTTSTSDRRMPSLGEAEIIARSSIIGSVVLSGISTQSALYPRLGFQFGVQLFDQPDGGPGKPIRDFDLVDLSGEWRLTEHGKTIGSLVWTTRRQPLRSGSFPYSQSLQLVCDLDDARVEGVEEFRRGNTFRPWIELSPTIVTRGGETLLAQIRPFSIVISQEDWAQILDGFGYGVHEIFEVRYNESSVPQIATAVEQLRTARAELNVGRYDRVGAACGRAVTALVSMLEQNRLADATDAKRGALYANVIAALAGLTGLPAASTRALGRGEAQFLVRATASAVGLMGDLTFQP